MFSLRIIASMRSAFAILLLCVGGALHAQVNAEQYAYRGMHLDVSRHFFSKNVILKFIDTLAANHINYFHWHLTDDQGWRIEIIRYPLLTSVGAFRKEQDGKTYGGYYTQLEIKEVVDYAALRGVTIIPEIDLPGHSSAAIAAYPMLSCHQQPIEVPNDWGIFKDVLCPTDSTLQFFKNVLDEVMDLFPSPYIHLGGDEVPKAQWKQSTYVSQLMKEKQLKNYEQVQHYIMQNLEAYVESKGRRCIMWGEALRGGVSSNTIIMSWRGKFAGIKAAKQGNEVIMAPRFYCYFDYPQSIKDKKHAWWMTYLPASKVSRFNPTSPLLNQEQSKRIIGAEATLWTEYVTTEKELWHQLLPRLNKFGIALQKVKQ